ncbi:putative histidine kinase [Magnetospirillum sp. XM-1]|uniref:PAS domain S-box protein n=1 Tax=Magnetospirillum sp. XM-1 TaxID=1663591 RepID=UPI00073DFE7D|nr:PAS domain S-box protein [Magnetospirillum sp. XM-1]CUW41716.1 putative histidine kinase [Magnetospirillum sp. XM-1]
MHLPPRPEQRVGEGRRRWAVYSLIPMAVLVWSIIGAVLLWSQERDAERLREKKAFSHQSERIQSMIEVQIKRVEDLLRAAMAEFSAPQGISRIRWEHFVKKIEVDRNYTGIIGIGYVAYVRRGELSLFMEERRMESHDFNVYPSDDIEDHMINTYLEPSAPLAKAIGYDVGSEPARRQTLERARDEGRLAISPKLDLLTAGNVLLYLPIYRHDASVHTVEARRAAIQGWAVASLVVADLLAGIVRSNENLDVELFDGEPSLNTLLLDSDQNPAGISAIAQYPDAIWSNLRVGGQTWRLYIANTTPSRPVFGRSGIVLAAGSVVALVLWGISQFLTSRYMFMARQATELANSLKQKEERLRLVLEYSNDAFWDWDVESDTAFYANHIHKMLGYSDEKISSNSEGLRQLMHPSDLAEVRKRFIGLLKSGGNRIDHEYRLKLKNGTWRWFRETAAIVERSGGRVTRMVGTVTDISTRRQAEDFLQLLSTVVEQSPFAVVITDAAGRIEYVNHHFVSLTGYTSDEVLGQTPALIKSGLTPPEVYKALWSAIESGREWRGELLNRKKDGDLYWEDTTITPVMNREGVTFYVAVKEDVTERKRLKQELQEQAKLPGQSPDPILRIARDGVILYANPAGQELLSHHPGISTEWRVTLISCLYGQLSKELELSLGERTYSFLFVPIHSADYVNVYGRDITKRHAAEERLRQGQKLEAIGTLAGGIAHDFNNILTSILGYNNLIFGDVDDREALADDVRQIHTAATRAKDLVRQILTFSRTTQGTKDSINLCAAIEETLPLIRAATPKTAEIKVSLIPRDAVILGTIVQIHQILLNLCGNAVDALIASRGVVDIKLERIRPGWVRLSVSDNGNGIPDSIRSRIFDPFFTTKPTGKGTGLGLSVVHGIVEDYGGRISVEAIAEGGTRFIIDFPETDQKLSVSTDHLADEIPPAGCLGSILVVDDEIAIAEMLERFLQRQGHTVRALSVGQIAMDIIQGGEKYDVVITDQMMPAVTGVDIANAVRVHSPETSVILCSGRDDQVTPEMCQAAAIAAFLVKPLNMIELIDTLDRLLAGRTHQSFSEPWRSLGGVKT